jgi:hypothetical protein
VTAAGEVRFSPDDGKRWRGLGDIGGQPAALPAQSASELYVALHDGTIKGSKDGGRTWSIRSKPYALVGVAAPGERGSFN